VGFRHIQQRDDRWCIVDLMGKHGRIRTTPMPNWVKVAIDAWTTSAGIADGQVFRPVIRGDRISGERLGEKFVWEMLHVYAAEIGIPGIAPHDLRRTCAKLCRAAGGELEQIQMLPRARLGPDDRALLGDEAGSRPRAERCDSARSACIKIQIIWWEGLLSPGIVFAQSDQSPNSA
jgi:integrase